MALTRAKLEELITAGEIEISGGRGFNVTAYGATGDGTTDDTASIIAAVAAASVKGGTVFFPAGRYKITETLFMYEGVNFEGESLPGRTSSYDYGTIIDYYGTGAAIQVAENPYDAVTCVSIKNLRINEAAMAQSGVGIRVGTDTGGYATDIKLEHIVVLGFDVGFSLAKCYAISANLCIARRSRIGWRILGKGTDDVAYGSLTASVFTSCGGYGYASGTPGTFFTAAGWLIERNCIYTVFIGCYWDGCEQGFKISGASAREAFIRCAVERFKTYGFYIKGTAANVGISAASIIINAGDDFSAPTNMIYFNGGVLTLRCMNLTSGVATKDLNVAAGEAQLDNVTYGTKTGTVKTYTIA